VHDTPKSEENKHFEPKIKTIDFRVGSLADILLSLADVRFAPESGHWDSTVACPLCAKSGHMQRSKTAFNHLAGKRYASAIASGINTREIRAHGNSLWRMFLRCREG
jgi:hypothetical protein